MNAPPLPRGLSPSVEAHLCHVSTRGRVGACARGCGDGADALAAARGGGMARGDAEIVLLRTVGLQWNLSASMPLGLYCRPSGPTPRRDSGGCLPTAMRVCAGRGYQSWSVDGVQPAQRIAQWKAMSYDATRGRHHHEPDPQSQCHTGCRGRLPHAPWGRSHCNRHDSGHESLHPTVWIPDLWRVSMFE